MSQDLKHHIKIYRNVFIALLFLTALTVGVTYIEFSSFGLGLFVGLLIASVKGYLVASQFMHLNDEKPFIYGTLIFTVIFFVVLIAIPKMWDANSNDIMTKRANPFDEFKNPIDEYKEKQKTKKSKYNGGY